VLKYDRNIVELKPNMNPDKISQETIQQALETLRRQPANPLDVMINGMRLRITVLTGTGARDEMSPQELSAFMKKAGPIFEGEEERIEALILEGREKTLLREPPVL
jgi:hypothetical protein